MFVNIRNAPDNRYFVVTVHEDFDRNGAKEMALSIMEHSQESEIKQLLIDLRSASNVDSVSDKFFFAHEDAKEIQLDKTLKVALLVHPSDHSHDFIETVMRNTGHNILTFHEEYKAVTWLCS